jgi:hypothetical protein
MMRLEGDLQPFTQLREKGRRDARRSRWSPRSPGSYQESQRAGGAHRDHDRGVYRLPSAVTPRKATSSSLLDLNLSFHGPSGPGRYLPAKMAIWAWHDFCQAYRLLTFSTPPYTVRQEILRR